LNQHFELIEKLARAREMLQSLRDAACPGAAALTGMPHTPGIKDKVGALAAEIVDMDARVGFLEEEVKASEGQIMPFIQGIDDDQTRLIFRLRFLRGLAWKEVAAVIGGRNSEDSVKMVCYRYLGS
jgi:hypothetical protein